MKYRPIIGRNRKWITELTEHHGGIHDQKKFKDGVRMLEYASEHFRRPNLCHICFTGANKAIYLAVIKRFCRGLGELDVRYVYKGCVEQEATKGLHLHLMLVLEHKDDGRPLYSLVNNSPSSVLGRAVGYYQDTSTIQYRVNRSHYSEDNFLYIGKTKYEPFNEAVEWLSYIYKLRSKPDSGTIYFSSRIKNKRTSTKAGFFSPEDGLQGKTENDPYAEHTGH